MNFPGRRLVSILLVLANMENSSLFTHFLQILQLHSIPCFSSRQEESSSSLLHFRRLETSLQLALLSHSFGCATRRTMHESMLHYLVSELQQNSRVSNIFFTISLHTWNHPFSSTHDHTFLHKLATCNLDCLYPSFSRQPMPSPSSFFKVFPFYVQSISFIMLASSSCPCHPICSRNFSRHLLVVETISS